MNTTKQKNKKKEGSNIKEKFTYEQPGYINVAGEVFFLDLNDSTNMITKLLFDPSVKGMNAFRMLFLEGHTPEYTDEEKKILTLIFRTVFGVNAGQKVKLPCDQKEIDLLVSSLLLRRSKLIQQMNDWNKHITGNDIHLRTLRDQLYKLNELIFEELPNSTYPCKDVGAITSMSSSGKPRLPLNNDRMKKLLAIFAYLLAQGKDPLDAFLDKNPSAADILPRLAKKDAPSLSEYEEEYKATHEGKDPVFTETLEKIKYILTNKSILPSSPAQEDIIKILEEIEKTFPDHSITGPTLLLGNADDRKVRIIKKINDLLNDLGKRILKLKDCDAKLQHANELHDCISNLVPQIEKLENNIKEIESVLGNGMVSKEEIEKILNQNKNLQNDIKKLTKQLADANKARKNAEDAMNIDTSISLPGPSSQTFITDPELLDTIQKISDEIDKISQEFQIDTGSIPDFVERFKVILSLLRNLRDSLIKKEEEIKQLQNDYNDLRDQANQAIQALRDENAELISEIDTLRIENDALVNETDDLRNENNMLDQEKNTLEQNNRLLSGQIQNLQQENDTLTRTNQNLTNERNTANQRNAQLDQQLKDLNDQIQKLQAENQRLEGLIKAQIITPDTDDQEQVKKLQEENDRLREQIDANTKQITTLRATVAGLEAQIKQLQEDLFNAQMERDDAIEKRQTAEENFLTSMGLQQQAQEALQEVQNELEEKNRILQAIRTLMVRKSAEFPNPILRNDGEDDISFYTRILNELMPDTRNDAFDEFLRALGLQNNPAWNLQDKKDRILETIRVLLQHKSAIARLFETLNQRFHVVREETDTDIQFYEKILRAMPQEDCGGFLDQIKIHLTNQGFQGDLTNQEKLNDLLRTIDANRIELDRIRNLTNRFINHLNALLRRLGLRGIIEINTPVVLIDSLLQSINQKVDANEALLDANRHALCLLYFFWNFLKNIFRDYESTFQKVAEMNLVIPDSIIEIVQKTILVLQQNGPPTPESPREYPDRDTLNKVFPELQTLVQNATGPNGFTEENRSIGAYMVAFFFSNIPNGNAINVQANGSIVLEPENNSATRIDMGILFLLLLTYTQKFLTTHANVLEEAGCDVGIQLRPQVPSPGPDPSPSPVVPADDTNNTNDNTNSNTDSDSGSNINDTEDDIIPGPLPPRPSPPGPLPPNPILPRRGQQICQGQKKKVQEYNPNLTDHTPYQITLLQESILQQFPFCLNIDNARRGGPEKGQTISYNENDLNRKMTQSIKEVFGERPSLQVLAPYMNSRAGIQLGLDRNGVVFAKVTSAKSGGTRKRKIKAKKSAKTKKLHK